MTNSLIWTLVITALGNIINHFSVVEATLVIRITFSFKSSTLSRLPVGKSSFVKTH